MEDEQNKTTNTDIVNNVADDIDEESSIELPSKEVSILVQRSKFLLCSECPEYIFLSQDQLTDHKLCHVDDSKDKDLVKGIILTRPKVKIEQCEMQECRDCSKVFAKNSKLYHFHKIAHLREKIKKEKIIKAEEPTDPRFTKRFKCPDCEARFVQESTLETHSIVHKPFPNVCHCGIGYYKKSDLKAHKKLIHESGDIDVWIPKIVLKEKTEDEVVEKTNKKRKGVL